MAVGNFVEGIFFLAVENLLEGIFVMKFFFWKGVGRSSILTRVLGTHLRYGDAAELLPDGDDHPK